MFAEQCGVDEDGQIDGCVDKNDNLAERFHPCTVSAVAYKKVDHNHVNHVILRQFCVSKLSVMLTKCNTANRKIS